MQKNDVVQFNSKHKWCGCLGIIENVNESDYLVGVPAPDHETFYIFVDPGEIEYIGKAVMVSSKTKEDD